MCTVSCLWKWHHHHTMRKKEEEGGKEAGWERGLGQ